MIFCPQIQQYRLSMAYSIVLVGLRGPGLFPAYKEAIEADPRLQAEVWRESRYYEKQSEMMRKFLTVLGVSLTAIFSLGAMILAWVGSPGAGVILCCKNMQDKGRWVTLVPFAKSERPGVWRCALPGTTATYSRDEGLFMNENQ